MSTKKNLTTFSLFAASVSGMIGSGWLLGPLTTAQIAGPASIISWIMSDYRGLCRIIVDYVRIVENYKQLSTAIFCVIQVFPCG